MTNRQQIGGLLIAGGVLCLIGAWFSWNGVPGFASFLQQGPVSNPPVQYDYTWWGGYNRVITNNDFTVQKTNQFQEIGITVQRNQVFRFLPIQRAALPFDIRCGKNTITISQELDLSRYYFFQSNKGKQGDCGEPDAKVSIRAPNGKVTIHVELVE